MPALRSLAAVALVAAAGTRTWADDTKEFLDPDNWEGHKQFWTLEGGKVVGTSTLNTKTNTFFVSKKKYADFELAFKVKLLNPRQNSGVQVRSVLTDRKNFLVAGPQAEIGPPAWGSLYGEGIGGMMKNAPGDKIKNLPKPNDFNDYLVTAKGKRITVTVNGETTVDDDFTTLPNRKPLPASGVIAFQMHSGPPMTVVFDEIRFTNLSKAK